ncbi:MAG: beta-eliminating lyase-related protein [Myxococcales bacterium]|nr:beta-eliminating lyase-related protein [Myxococcales bacterium]
MNDESDSAEVVDLRSDNEAPAAPEIMAAIERANRGPAAAYGQDAISARTRDLFCDLFETDVAVFPVLTGTAANALCIAQIAPPFGSVFCHPHAHLNTDECGAPEFFSAGAKLMGVAGEHARIDPGALREAIEGTDDLDVHQCKSAGLSLSQSTELGTVYPVAQLAQLSALAHDAGLRVHMDGARLANAIASAGCSPAEMTWRAGIDMLSFGATKNGALAAEAILVFDRDLADGLERRRKRAGHLLSKMRYVAAQLEAYVADGLWLRLAQRANRAAGALAAGLARVPGVEIPHPVEANEIFARMPRALAEGLAKEGVAFLRWPGAPDLYRLVAAWCTSDAAVARVLACAERVARAHARM